MQYVTTIIFAHNNESIPNEFIHYEQSRNKYPKDLSPRQIRKWKSQRIAYFLLHKLFEMYYLDKDLLKKIERTESGRPYIPNSGIDFNISHSGEWVAIIFSHHKTKKLVGIDIEHPQKIRNFNKLLNYYANKKEISEINNKIILPELSTIESRFYLSWCLREAILKSQGVGIVKLSEVEHSLYSRKITTAYSPQGQLYFYHQLPFYLAYFVEQPHSVLSLPPILRQWKNGDFISYTHIKPIIYQVNQGTYE